MLVHKISTSTRIYIVLVLVLAVSNTIQVLLPSYQSLVPSASPPAPVYVIALLNAGIGIVLYGGLGYLGLILARRLGFADLYESGVTNRQRFLIPGLIGAALSVFLIVGDIIFSHFNGIGRLQHPPFPSSIFASLSAGIGEEIIFRLFFISFWVWLVSKVLLRGWGQGPVFWVFTSLSALAFALGHLPSVMMLYNFNSFNDVTAGLLAEVILLNGVVSVFAAYYMRKSGFLAAASIHFWTDIVWHVVWGLFS
jgi:membrane protease YdiL (CAAX protease family)